MSDNALVIRFHPVGGEDVLVISCCGGSQGRLRPAGGGAHLRWYAQRRSCTSYWYTYDTSVPSTSPRSPWSSTGTAGGAAAGQEIAACTSSAIFFSTSGLQFFNAYDTGHMSPSSRCAGSWKPRVE